MSELPSGRLDQREILALGLVCAAALVVIGLPSLPPGTDAPTHLAMAEVLAGDVPASLDTGWTPTSQLFVRIVALFSLVFSMKWAAFAALSASLALWMTGAGMLARDRGGNPALAACLAAPPFLGFAYAMGFYNFLLGCALGVWLAVGLARVCKQEDDRIHSPLSVRAGVAGLGALVAHAHIIAFIMSACHAGGMLVLDPNINPRDRARRFAHSIGYLSVGTVYSLVVLGSVFASEATPERVMWRAPFAEVLRRGVAVGAEGFSEAGLVAGILVFALALAAITQRAARTPLVVATIWFAAYAFIPFHVPGWAYAQPRLLLFAALALSTAAASGKWRPNLILLIGACIATVLVFEAIDEARVADSVSETRDAFGDVRPGEETMVVRLSGGEGEGAHLQPLTHADEYLVTAGEVPSSFLRFNSTIHSVHSAGGVEWPEPPAPFYYMSFRCGSRDAPQDCESDHRAYADRVAVQSRAWDTMVVIAQSSAFVDQMHVRGMERLAEARWRPVTTHADFVIDAAPGTRIELALGLETLGAYAGVAGAVDTGGEARVRVDGLLHGETVVELRVSPPGSSAPPQPIARQSVRLPLDEPLYIDLRGEP